MRSKEYLKSIRNETIELKHLEEKIKWLYSSLFPGGLKYKEVDVQESTPPDLLSEKFAEIDEAAAELKERMEALAMKHLEAEHLISLLEDTKHRTVLELYYLSERKTSLEKVAEKMEYSPRGIFYLYHDALTALDVVMEAENIEAEAAGSIK